MELDSEYWMGRALELAEKALLEGEVPVGCLFLLDGTVIAEGRNTTNQTHNPTRHAEIHCIDVVLSSYGLETLSQVDVVVTVEPCGMCAAALLELPIRSLVYGCPNDRFGGCGSVVDVPRLIGSEVPVTSGVRSQRAMDLLKLFYSGKNPNAPPDKVKVKKSICKVRLQE